MSWPCRSAVELPVLFIRKFGVTPQKVQHYFDSLVARIKCAVRVPWHRWPRGVSHRCHQTVDAFAASHPGFHAVRGWLVTPAPGVHMFHAHSVIRQPDGNLIDVTPGERHRAGLVFLEH